MKTIIFFAVIAFAAANLDYYDLEKIDMSELIKDTDGFKKFIGCELGREECSKLYSTYRAVTAEAVVQKCKKCTPDQKHSFWVWLQGLKEKYPNDYLSFRQMYDPDNKYFDALEAELEKYSVNY